MAKIVRLTEQDLVRLVNRVIKEQQTILNDVGSIPCIKHKFVGGVFKISDRKILSKFQGKSIGSPVLSNKNVILIDKTKISVPEKKWGTATIIANGNVVNTFSLDGTTLGDEIYTLTDVVMSGESQDESKFKIGWVLCNDGLYLYDIIDEQIKN